MNFPSHCVTLARSGRINATELHDVMARTGVRNCAKRTEKRPQPRGGLTSSHVTSKDAHGDQSTTEHWPTTLLYHRAEDNGIVTFPCEKEKSKIVCLIGHDFILTAKAISQ